MSMTQTATVRRYDDTSLALRTGIEETQYNLTVNHGQFFGDNVVLASGSFWDGFCAEFYQQDMQAVSLQTTDCFINAIDSAADEHPDLQHGLDRLAEVMRHAQSQGFEAITINLH